MSLTVSRSKSLIFYGPLYTSLVTLLFPFSLIKLCKISVKSVKRNDVKKLINILKRISPLRLSTL